jgi:hypothetical protein
LALAATTAAIGALQLAAPDPASAVAGLQLVQGDSFENRDEPFKYATAVCPSGKVVVGGGGEVLDGSRTLVRLKSLYPHTADPPALRSSFNAMADAVNETRAYDWTLRAYAICVNRSALSSYSIVRSPSSSQDPATVKTATAVCPSGTVAYGSGASAGLNPNGAADGKVWLQLNRTGGNNDLSRAVGRALPGYNESWSVSSWAICARPLGGIHFDGAISQGAEASDRCASGFRTHGIGGGGAPFMDGGPAWLDKIAPHPDLRGVDVTLTAPLYPSIGGMVAHQRCAS